MEAIVEAGEASVTTREFERVADADAYVDGDADHHREFRQRIVRGSRRVHIDGDGARIRETDHDIIDHVGYGLTFADEQP